MSIIDKAFTVYKIIGAMECLLYPLVSFLVDPSMVFTQSKSVASHTSSQTV